MSNKRTITNREHTFELVDFVPLGYEIWNIGRNMAPGYLPLCRISARQPFQGGRNIEVDTLKAIQIDEAQVILDAVGYGPATLKTMERYVERHGDAKPGSRYYTAVQRMKKALPFMRQIWK